MNNIKNIIIITLLLMFINPIIVKAESKTISDIKINTNNDGITNITGTCVSDIDSFKLIIKIYNENNELDFFDLITVTNNEFDFNYSPSKTGKIEDGDTLKLNISGEIKYEKQFYYSSKYKNDEEENNESIEEVLKDYNEYYDDKISQNLKFETEYEQNSDYIKVILKGKNFIISDNNWKLKDDGKWYNYLNTIITKLKKISNKSIWIYIYDSNDTELEIYPEKEPETTFKYITQEKLNELTDDINSFTYKDIDYKFNFVLLNEKKTDYIKIKAISEYSKQDEELKNLNKDKLESYANKVSKAIKKEYNANIDILFYDKDSNLIKTYNFEYLDENVNNDDIDDIEYIPWNKNKATGLVLMLRVSDYGDNSAEINTTVQEGNKDGLYQYEINLDEDDLQKKLDSLRSDSQKIVYVKNETQSNNLSLNISSNIVDTLKESKSLFILDTNNYKVELDFEKIKKSGEIEIQTKDVEMDASDFSKPVFIQILLNNKEATESFKDGIKCLIHYDSEKTREIKDLRSINIFNSKSEMFNTTASTKEKGFIFKYKDADIYYSKNNQYTFNDIVLDDPKYKKYAELVASKEIIPGINNGKFNPDQELTRGDFIYYISKKMGAISETNHFNDLDPNYSYFKEVNGVYELNVLPSFYSPSIAINTPITIEEVIYITMRCYEINDLNEQNIQTASLLYVDKNDISIWCQPKVSKAVKLNLIPSDGYLLPKDKAKKIDAAEILYNLLVSEKIF